MIWHLDIRFHTSKQQVFNTMTQLVIFGKQTRAFDDVFSYVKILVRKLYDPYSEGQSEA